MKTIKLMIAAIITTFVINISANAFELNKYTYTADEAFRQVAEETLNAYNEYSTKVMINNVVYFDTTKELLDKLGIDQIPSDGYCFIDEHTGYDIYPLKFSWLVFVLTIVE